MMEAVKLGRLDLIESLMRAGGRLDVQVGGECIPTPDVTIQRATRIPLPTATGNMYSHLG